MCDDLQVAMTGIAPGGLWITRMRSVLPASALAANLVVEATASQEQEAAVLPALDALRPRVPRLPVHLGLREQDLRVAASVVRNAIG